MTRPSPPLRFLAGLDADLRQSLLSQIRDTWTHNSTALEGNSLSLGDTKFVIEEGLTVAGKPVKDHQEVHRPRRRHHPDLWPARPGRY